MRTRIVIAAAAAVLLVAVGMTVWWARPGDAPLDAATGRPIPKLPS